MCLKKSDFCKKKNPIISGIQILWDILSKKELYSQSILKISQNFTRINTYKNKCYYKSEERQELIIFLKKYQEYLDKDLSSQRREVVSIGDHLC